MNSEVKHAHACLQDQGSSASARDDPAPYSSDVMSVYMGACTPVVPACTQVSSDEPWGLFWTPQSLQDRLTSSKALGCFYGCMHLAGFHMASAHKLKMVFFQKLFARACKGGCGPELIQKRGKLPLEMFWSHLHGRALQLNGNCVAG